MVEHWLTPGRLFQSASVQGLPSFAPQSALWICSRFDLAIAAEFVIVPS
jgi:hypothetical protein